eukprot:3999240-Pleurochrysis_carterae.AAC.1
MATCDASASAALFARAADDSSADCSAGSTRQLSMLASPSAPDPPPSPPRASAVVRRPKWSSVSNSASVAVSSCIARAASMDSEPASASRDKAACALAAARSCCLLANSQPARACSDSKSISGIGCSSGSPTPPAHTPTIGKLPSFAAPICEAKDASALMSSCLSGGGSRPHSTAGSARPLAAMLGNASPSASASACASRYSPPPCTLLLLEPRERVAQHRGNCGRERLWRRSVGELTHADGRCKRTALPSQGKLRLSDCRHERVALRGHAAQHPADDAPKGSARA